MTVLKMIIGCLTVQMVAELQRNANENTAINNQKNETNQLEENKLGQINNVSISYSTHFIERRSNKR